MRFGVVEDSGVWNGTSTLAGMIISVLHVHRIAGVQRGFGGLSFGGITCVNVRLGDATAFFCTLGSTLVGCTIGGIFVGCTLGGVLVNGTLGGASFETLETSTSDI